MTSESRSFAKHNFDQTYNRSDPRSYFSTLRPLDYRIHRTAIPVFASAKWMSLSVFPWGNGFCHTQSPPVHGTGYKNSICNAKTNRTSDGRRRPGKR